MSIMSSTSLRFDLCAPINHFIYSWLPVLPDGPLGTFVENLGPGQVVGRQVLASPLLGEIQVGIMAGRSGIDVEIIRAKNLVVKPGVKISPGSLVLSDMYISKYMLLKRAQEGVMVQLNSISYHKVRTLTKKEQI